MHRTGLLFVFLSSIVLGSAVDWPQLLGPDRNGTYSGKDLNLDWPNNGPKRLWSNPVGKGWSSPVVSGEQVIIFHRDGGEEIIQCLKTTDGREIWKASYPAEYVDGYGFEDGPRATPAIHGNKVYSHGANGDVRCNELSTGRLLWNLAAKKKFNAPNGFFGFGSSPIVTDGKVLLNIGGTPDASIIALNTATGKLVWKAFSDEASYSSPSVARIAGTKQAIFFTRMNVVSVSPSDGKILWKDRLAPNIHTSVAAAAPLIAGNRVFATASYGAGAVLFEAGKSSAKKIWSNDDSLSSQYTTGVIKDGHIYGFHGRVDTGPRPQLRCIELDTGKVKWSNSRVDCGAIILAGNKLIVLTQSGQLVTLDAKPESPGRIHPIQILGDKIRSHPALANGLLFARDTRQLICIDLRK
ncbi:MAG: alcohol dehydrogenase [Verrucomicrobiales bacterium]|nr:alcohol dehydrogenase [Verrucomicrobiales bacterium]